MRTIKVLFITMVLVLSPFSFSQAGGSQAAAESWRSI